MGGPQARAGSVHSDAVPWGGGIFSQRGPGLLKAEAGVFPQVSATWGKRPVPCPEVPLSGPNRLSSSLETWGNLHPFPLPGPDSGEAGGWLRNLGTFPWQMAPAGTPCSGEGGLSEGMDCWDVPQRQGWRAH